MDEIFTKIQVYLIKKDKECETLRFLTSRTTPSNAAHVSDICNTIKTILQNSTGGEMPINSIIDEKSIQYFKFLLLNTNFRAQEYLCEDIANGHLVDMCPPLSPYLFIEILWALNYEEILCNSILYIPLDLCSEILDTLRRCLDVDFQRAYHVVLKVITKCFKKLVSMIYQDAQVLEEQESVTRFMGSVEELFSSLAGLQSNKTEGLSQLLKYERAGWVLIQLLNTMKDCIASRRAGNVLWIGEENLEKLYRVTFGRNFVVRLDPVVVTEAVDLFSKEFINLLLGNVKKIDCYVYMGWMEIDWAEDTSISMQRAVGLACYHFIEFLGDDKQSEECNHLIECLRQISSKPDSPLSMSLQELCDEVDKGSSECLAKLIERFKEWDSKAISCLDKNRSLINKDKCLSLLNNTVEFLQITSQGELCAEVYGTVMKIFLGQRLIDMIEILVEFILIHDASRVLESVNFEPDFNSYVNQGLALCSSRISLRIILFFAIQNPRQVLETLTKAAIGYPEHANSMMLPQDLCKLSPVIQIRDSNNLLLFSNTLKVICCENLPWSTKKFAELICVVLDKNLLSADDLLNDIFIPALRNEIILENMQSILTCIRTMKNDLTMKTKHKLLHALALQIANLRRNTDLSMYSREEVLNLLTRTVQDCAGERINSTIYDETDLFLQKLEASLEPLDKIYFAPHWGWIEHEICLYHVLHDYTKRCFYVMNKPKTVKTSCTDLEELFETHGLEMGEFLQHLILQCTEFEYLKFAKEAMILHWNYFGWKNEEDAYTQFSLATIKACNNYLQSFDLINSPKFLSQKFASLIKSLAKLTIWFISIDAMTDYESVYKSLVAAMSTLDLNPTVFPDLSQSYKELKSSFDQTIGNVYSYPVLAELVHNVVKFGDHCLCQLNHPVANIKPRSLSALTFYTNSTFISICLNWPKGENSLLLSKIDKKLYSRCEHDVRTNITS